MRVPIKAASAVAVAMTILAGAGASTNWLLTKETTTGESDARNIFCEQSSSGSGLCLRETGKIVFSGGLISQSGSSLGWSVVAGANTACKTTCTNACVFGFDDGAADAELIVDCDDATADRCTCAGAN